MLKSLTIKNFRSLADFEVAKLGRVNLIVGKNNSGKSSVLEALRIYAGNAHQELLEKIAQAHDEKHFLDKDAKEGIEVSLPYADLFTGRQFPTDGRPIVIGELDNEEALKIYHVYTVEKDYIATDEEGNKETIKRKVSISNLELTEHSQVLGEGLSIRKNGGTGVKIDFNVIDPDFRRFTTLAIPPSPCSFIPTQLIPMNELASNWDNIALTEAEETVKDAMKIILPEFESLIFVNDSPYDESKPIRRIAKVKVKGLKRPIPLNSLGDGMLRIMQFVLKIFPAKGGFFLIDEFENGLHYSVQEKVWALLFEMAEKLDIQVFATTHSWDCIESFSKVAIDRKDIYGVLFRVGKSVRKSDRDRVIATVFDEEALYSITQSDVEVR
ncbi:AAA family ATPase [Methylicorpusculum sp.]|uniref:AAA family ATPase n=1 Tax=Methylicorpusculum sp. TaxID=2713644 RepID=UPI0027306CA6|nr:ATP-binding protein [Methylicorpusculum sp.]MDP2180730.1 AAA family ATPase [Methylicorpusculum sp.]MDZ4149621.1 AAA family ATPase [Methylicorpusculum sp.]